MTWLVFILGVCLLPGDALAWGAITHLKFAETVLANRMLLPPGIGLLLADFPAHFAYGNIIADLILGKRYRIEYRDHSHNWDVGFRLLDEANTPPLQAAMWGYLSHLAADVVAHQIFIPTKIAAAQSRVFRGHGAWEAAFDADFPKEYLHIADQLEQQAGFEVDSYLMGSLRRTLFSHPLNKRIFRAQIVAQRTPGYQLALDNLVRRSRHAPDPGTRAFYLQRSLDAVYDLLQFGTQAQVVQYDPTGHDRIALARLVRRRGEFEDLKVAQAAGKLLPLTDVRLRFADALVDVPTHEFERVDFSGLWLPRQVLRQ